MDFRKGAKLDPTQVEDRRGMRGVRGGRGMAVGGGAGVVGVIVVLLITLLGGDIDLQTPMPHFRFPGLTPGATST